MKDMTKNILLWVVIAFALLSMFNYFSPRGKTDPAMTYTNFIAAINQGSIRQVNIEGDVISGMTTDGDRFMTYNPGDPHLVDDLLKNHVDIKVVPPERPSFLTQLFMATFPMLLLIGVWIYFMRRMQGGGVLAIARDQAHRRRRRLQFAIAVVEQQHILARQRGPHHVQSRPILHRSAWIVAF